MAKIGFIGTGHIAAPMVRFLATRGHQTIVSERNAQTAAALAASHWVAVADNQFVLDASDIVFLALRPQVADEVVAELTFKPQHRVISVMAGVSLGQLGRLCAPATDITMTIPLGYLEQGGCPLPACPDGDALRPLFEPENPVLDVSDEAAFNMHFAVCAFVPGLLDLMATASAWLADQTGDADQAGRYTQQLITGFLNALPEGDADVLARERDALATEGTISLQMVMGLRQGGADQAVIKALAAIGARLQGQN